MKFAVASGLFASLTLAACSAPSEESTPSPQTGAATDAAEELGQPELPQEFARTAWRTQDEDGARFITYLDAGGTYRDLRNGDPFQTGTWEVDEEGRLCFMPDDENGGEQCWRPDTMRDADTMIVTSKSGRRVALERVDYPQSENEAGGEDTAS